MEVYKEEALSNIPFEKPLANLRDEHKRKVHCFPNLKGFSFIQNQTQYPIFNLVLSFYLY